MFKKAQMMGPRKIISLVLGIILLALGGIPLAGILGVFDFTLPALPAMVLWILFIIGGVWLVVDGFMAGNFHPIVMWPSIIIGLAILALGILPLLASMGIIGFVLPDFGIMISAIIDVVAGLLLLIGGFIGF